MDKPIPFGKYYLLERINVGGMAEVFRAKQFGVEGFERLVAVKRILPNIAEDKDFIEMFVDEAKISVQLNHANIAQVFDLGHEEGSYYIALEHIHGRDLRAIFDRNRNKGEPMPVPQACFVTMKVCEGLDYAHNKRDETGREIDLVHRDVSPQNVIVSFDGEVKLIDFGIAKAAGKGSQTQAGILKGKFGYMSPEQVRGLPIDRRSDVFSCGIVLYELLTGERLFIGESDFSTLEKVRNVEILPPSTYNRKVPPELERIVLKALAKDVEDRYQNAIDLHDELQAFVYTAGEFYSRKDLASWMKQEWGEELSEEKAKLASYRDMTPPVPTRPPQDRLPQRKSNPPPIPAAQAVAPDTRGTGELEWDDDELETSIYDEEPPKLEPKSVSPGSITSEERPMPGLAAAAESSTQTEEGARSASDSGAGAARDTLISTRDEPDLSSLVPPSTWDGETETIEEGEPGRLADGSNKTQSPFPEAAAPMLRPEQASTFPPPVNENSDRKKLLLALIAGCIVTAAAIVLIVLVSRSSGGDDGQEASANSAATGDAASQGQENTEVTMPGPATPATGFDLIVDPPGVQVRLDGRAIGKAPLQIRSVTPGEHFIEIEGPAGFFSKHETVKVQAEQAHRVAITLDAMDITGVFNSEPEGATVELVADGDVKELGQTPLEVALNPRKSYEVVFRKDGYHSYKQALVVTGSPEIAVRADLSRRRRGEDSSTAMAVPKPNTPTPAVNDDPKPAPTEPEDLEPPPAPKPPKVKAEGTLLLSAKPPCKIYIDGRDTGLMTPQRGISLPVGQHRVTLLHNEYGIRESFTVKIKAGEATRAIRDFTDQVR